VTVTDDDTPSPDGVLLNSTLDLVRDVSGEWWIAHLRSAGQDTAGAPSLTRWQTSGTAPVYSSGVDPNIDLGNSMGNLDIDNARDRIVMGRGAGGGVFIVDISTPDAPAILETLPQGGEARDVSFDAAGNVYVVSEDTETLRITTYNLGLAPTFVPLVAERVALLLEALAAHDTDVLCLEEVWRPEHVAAVQTAIGDTYPYTYWVAPEQRFTETAPCTQDEVDPIIDCLETSCSEQSGDEFTACAISNCAQLLFELKEVDPTCGAAIPGKSLNGPGRPMASA
jgi:hypothetical protein